MRQVAIPLRKTINYGTIIDDLIRNRTYIALKLLIIDQYCDWIKQISESFY